MSKTTALSVKSALEARKMFFWFSKVRWKLEKDFFNSPKFFGSSKNCFLTHQSSLEAQKTFFWINPVLEKVKKDFFE